MSDYTLNVIPLSALTFSGATPNHNTGGGEGWNFQSYSFTYDPSQTVAANIADGDDTFQDDPLNPEWSGGSWSPHSQVLGAPLTIGGTTYAAGTQMEDEYEFDVTDQFGTTYRLVAVATFDGFNFNVVGYTFEGATPPSGAILTSVPGSSRDGQSIADPVCFARGTLIATPAGAQPIETLRAGDLVATADGRAEPIVWIGRRAVSAATTAETPGMRPVRIAAGALGNGLPLRDLRVSPQHRILIRSEIVARMLGGPREALVAAKHLVGMPGIAIGETARGIEYWHIMCRSHEVVRAEGSPAETLLPGTEALKALGYRARRELRTLLPGLETGLSRDAAARPILPRRRAEALTRRHARNRKALVSPE